MASRQTVDGQSGSGTRKALPQDTTRHTVSQNRRQMTISSSVVIGRIEEIFLFGTVGERIPIKRRGLKPAVGV